MKQSAVRWLSAGSLIEPLVKVYEITGNTKALKLAEGITHNYIDPKNGYFGDKGEFSGFFRPIMGIVNGMSQYAALCGEDKIVNRAKTIHDYAISKCTAYGSTAGREPACSDMELNYSALSFIKAGHDEYWDQIDRFIRNQTIESQFLDVNEWVKEKARKTRITEPRAKWAYEYYPDDLHILPHSDYRDVLNRSIGGFCWTSDNEHIFLPALLMICCSGNAMRSFSLIQDNAIVKGEDMVSVNLHYNLENNVGEIISYEPYCGKVSATLKEDDNLRIRIPEYAVGTKINGYKDGKEIDIKRNGRYAYFGTAQKGAEYSLTYPLRKSIEEDTQYYLMPDVPADQQNSETALSKKLEVQWRGNTVIKVLPQSLEEKSIYKRSHLDTDEVPYESVSHFITDKNLRW